jgi:NAD(P)-dependent dehydrogenase (short-subunit alcohol dehydrogenase family)
VGGKTRSIASGGVKRRPATRKTLNGRTVLVTGGAKRIGRATALSLAAEGADIVVHDHHSLRGDCEKLCGELEKLGVRSWIITADFAVQSDCQSLISRAVKASGRVDILINNASVFSPDTIVDASYDEVVRKMQINAWAPLVISREFDRHTDSGKIVNILDTRIAGFDFKHLSYIMSKHALHLLTRMTAIEFAPGIAVNSVAPGLILPPEGKDTEYIEALAKTVPLRRHGDPRDVTDAVLFLLRSDFITGQVIFVDGGRHLMEYLDGPDTDH